MSRKQANPLPSVENWLTAKMPSVTVSQAVPKDWTPEQAPLITIADDGGTVVTAWTGDIVRSYHTVRVTARGRARTTTIELACVAAGHLSTARIAGIKVIGVGAVVDARDPATGAALASVLVNLCARSVPM